MKQKPLIELRVLKGILLTYIILCVVIAGLNYGYVSHASPKVAAFIGWFWMFYENWLKTLIIIVCSVLTLRVVGKSKRTTMRKRNLIGLIIAALIVHIIMPLTVGNGEMYFYAMPLPWSTTPLQLMNTQSSFFMRQTLAWGAAGISAALIFYVCVCGVVLAGTLLFGRRWQCSTLCLFNGFAAEVFDPAIPLLGKKKTVSLKLLKFFKVLRWVFLAIALFFTLWWVLFLAGISVPGNPEVLGKIEVYKYLVAELLMAMFFWIAFLGRGYCYYCPLGTVLGLISKAAGQKIVTDETNCIQCGQCNKACPMTIDIKSKAIDGLSAQALRCVGCGHCVDACPTGTLRYSTRFLNLCRKSKVLDKSPEHK